MESLVRNRLSNVRTVPTGSAGETSKISAQSEGCKKEGKRSWVVYDTLYVNGEPVRP
ncbi:hypothetical protein DPMN_010201 [Dreissena polymorpha]|uniref:Uncharacterized protein n=1 Tax=Dreissena polymorpha TaxID=45954 RepID=A0A9D4S0R5_DREPO|nr:hypothetical protein DPMN_010201 [Dreissena polymorpha]